MRIKVLSRQDIEKFSYSGAQEMKNIFVALKESGVMECRAIKPNEY